MPGARAVASPAAITDEVDLVFVTVPDDALADVAAQLRLYAGQAAVHTSGALGAGVLEPAQAAGTAIGSFHPLVAFADLEAALAALPGATVALEGSEELLSLLAELATDIGAQPVRLPPGGKPAYHAAAVLAAGGFVGLLDAIAEVARGAGLDEAGALAIYGPLIRGSLANAERLGVEAALTGPFVRGDEGTVRGHLGGPGPPRPRRPAGLPGAGPAGAGHGCPPRGAGRRARRGTAPPAGGLRGATIGACSAASARSA